MALAVLLGPLPGTAPLSVAVTSAPTAHAAAGQPTIGSAALDAAITDLRHDPNLGGQTKRRTLRWVTEPRPTPPAKSPAWLVRLFDTIGQFGGLLVWVAGAGAAAAGIVWILRLRSARRPRAVPQPPDVTRGQVFELDIDPGRLPADVGSAALELLRAGRVRDCLSLLYRASLSCAVHRFGAQIGAHHTEREVLGAMRGALDEPRTRYVADLVAIRQRVVYAGEAVTPDLIQPLCARFPTLFGPPAP